MESIYTDLALYGNKNEFARTNTVFLTISEVCEVTVSFTNFDILVLASPGGKYWQSLFSALPLQLGLYFPVLPIINYYHL